MRYDLVVVGGGHNGLVCAACAARAGLSVVVLERQARLGGAAVTEEFAPGFRNSAASYTVSLLDPGIVATLDLARHGLTIVPRPLDNFVPTLEGPGLALGGDTASRAASIARFSRRDADAYARYARDLDAVVRLVRPFLGEAPVAPFASRAEFARALKVARRTLGSGPRSIAATLALLRKSAGDWLDGYFATDLLKGALGFDSVVGHFASPYGPGSAYLLLHHCLGQAVGRPGAWGHAIGGMGAITDALAGACRERGVELRCSEPVDRIAPDDDGFAVETAGGVVRGRRIAAAIHPRRLFLDLIDREHLPEAFRQRIEAWRSESASFRLNVALAELPDFRCAPGTRPAVHHGAGILVTPSLDYLDRAFRSAVRTGMSAEPVVELVIPSVIDDSLAPPGRHVASLFCQHFRYTLPGGLSWDSARDTAVARIFATIDAYAPNFSRSVIAVKASSPLDLERRFGLVGGDIFHGAMVRGQLYHERPATGYARYRTPVPGLYLCAAGAHPGGGVSGLPGRNAARAIVEDLSAGDRRPLLDDGDRDRLGANRR